MSSTVYSVYESVALRTFKKVRGGYELLVDVEAAPVTELDSTDQEGFDAALKSSGGGVMVLKAGTKVVPRTSGEFIVHREATADRAAGAWVFIELAL